MTKILKFKCELLSDVILNQKAASEGPNQTLDFIPGSNFLGIAAAGIYPNVPTDTRLDMDLAGVLFHSGKVSFGDAHPGHDGHRTLRVPADLFFAKGESESERRHYMHHAIYPDKIPDGVQLKQERTGFVDFDYNDRKAVRLKPSTNFAIKSAYDRISRRSKDAQMFGYQSMEKGQVFYFSVEIADGLPEDCESIIREALLGEKRIGRSRSAEYGLVCILEENFSEIGSGTKETSELVIYADSRLIFLDEYGMPTHTPDVAQLIGEEYCKDASILWEKSQIRTFRYAPYNYKRKCFDTDRCGIEKGSVLVVKTGTPVNPSVLNSWIGSYRNEGFGKVIFNPSFLDADNDGKAPYSISIDSGCRPDSAVKTDVKKPDTLLVSYILARKENDEILAKVYETVNGWVTGNKRLFTGREFASQFGNIRNLALKSKSQKELFEKLFKGEDKGKEMPESDKGYLVHGIAKERWEGCRKEELKKFVSAYNPKYVVLLANAMQKECSMKKQGGNNK